MDSEYVDPIPGDKIPARFKAFTAAKKGYIAGALSERQRYEVKLRDVRRLVSDCHEALGEKHLNLQAALALLDELAKRGK